MTDRLHGETAPPRESSEEQSRQMLFAAFCAPGVVAAATLSLDHLTRQVAGSALTTWGFLGSLVGLAAFFSGFASILAWPGVVLLCIRSLRSQGVGVLGRWLAAVGCLVATYSAVFFVVWFIIIPITAAR